MKRTTILPTLVVATLLAASCSSDTNDAADPSTLDDSIVDDGDGNDNGDDDDNGGTTPDRSDDPARSAKVALQQFDQCDAFLDYVHTEGAERVGAYGFNDAGWYGGGFFIDDAMEMEMIDEDDAMEEAATVEVRSVDDVSDAGDSATSAPAEAQGGADADFGAESGSSGEFSTTNVQVEGVDEPDVIKTDGTRILAVANERLHYVDVDSSDGTARGSIALSNNDNGGQFGYIYGQEILVSGDRAFVIAQGEGGYGPTAFEDIAVSEPIFEDDAEAQFADFAIEEPMLIEPFPGPEGQRFGPTTVVVEVDLSDPDQLRVVNTLNLDGRYISARSIGDTVRVALTTGPQDLGFLFPSSPSATDSAIAANQDLVRNTTVEDWVPSYTLSDAAGNASSGALVDCDQIHAPGEFAGFDMLSVVTLSLDTGLDAPSATTSVMATGDTVYASQDRMYISTNEWLPPTLDEQERGDWEETYQTGIHRFALPADGAAVYEASGTVDGHLLNQFSMNDRDGTFFVATTTGTPWSSNGSESQIVSMQVNGDRLEQVGRVGGLGEGEQIFSVRYVDNVAYVVTFRQTDPFYVIDISAPTDLSVLGELKIPGVSNYLHPISDTLVIGVGQDATDDGRQTGSKVSLFDVSDYSNPLELDVWTLPNSNSDAEFDHRAFLWWANTNTAVLPLTSWSDQFSGAVVLNITADGIVEQGRISHVDDVQVEPGQTDCDVFDGTGLSEDDGELFWATQDEYSQLQLCGAGDSGGATGHYCEVIPVGEVENWFGYDIFADASVNLDGVDRIEWCWIDGGVDWQKQIRRTLVIDGNLWTMSNARLQSNALDSLDTLDVVEL